MKKLSHKIRLYFALRQRKRLAKETRIAHAYKHNRKHFTRLEQKAKRKDPTFYETYDLRRKIIKAMYKKRRYTKAPLEIHIDHDLGIESPSDIDFFLDKASSFIDFDNKHLYLNFSKCNRVWPSGITLLCSLKKWTELTGKSHQRPMIASSPSNNVTVNSYLMHSGFYDYVGRAPDTDQNYYSDKDVVKIKREKRRSNPETREKEIKNLLKLYSVLSADEILMFDCVILTEVFANVTEHGISESDAGWWILAQYHKTHKFISICIADNGIGIRNSLMTGPQRHEIEKYISNSHSNDGNFIFHALTENVSGALAASTKTGIILKSYKSGARRGHGLKRICNYCEKLNIQFSIISHYGYAFLDGKGKLISKGSKNSRIFAGTLHHFLIRAK